MNVLIIKKIRVSISIFFVFVIAFTILYKVFANYSWQHSLYISVAEQTFTGATIEDKTGEIIATGQMITAYIFIAIILYDLFR